MTVREVLAAIARRWYVVVVVCVAAVLLAFAMFRDGGIYTTRTVIAFTLPATTTLTFSNGLDDANVIAFAGAVTEEVNNGRPPARYSTDEAPFFGAGVREGVLVSLASAGNQWVSSFLRAEVEVQVVGRSYEWVEERQKQLVDRVIAVAEQQQTVAGIAPESRIETSVIPLTLHIDYIAPSRTSQLIAGAALAGAAVIVSCWLAVVVDRIVRRTRRTGRRRSSPSAEPLGVPSP